MNHAVLDDVFQSESTPILVEASKEKRFANYLIDYIGMLVFIFVFFFLLAIAELVTEDSFLVNFLPYIIYPAYYFLIEHFTQGKSLGKFITKTRVVTVQGDTPSAGAILGRSFARIIPFEAFSFLNSDPNGWHDRLSGTIVVDEKKSKLPMQNNGLV